MSGLPPALAPWAAQLSGFAPELVVSLGAWLRRIAAAIGPLGGASAGPGEPDGLSGIARRGSYERLLVSEWLLADAFPEEFVRRAATGEHLFLERGVRAPHSGRRSVALLDAGPDQLGTPRIAQLALLVVLAARADAAGVAFAWGIAQDAAGGLAEGFGEAQARRFLAARSPRPPDAVALRSWGDALPPGQAPDDRWMLGGPALLALAPPQATRVSILDVPDPAAREVRIEIRRGGGRVEVVLPLPRRTDCTRLLRDPFHEVVAEPVAASGRIVPEAGVLWAPSGRRIAVRLQDGAVLDAHVPGSPREPPGRARRHFAEALVGFGWARKRQRQVVLATRREDRLLLRLGRNDVRGATAEEGVALPEAADIRAPLAACHPWPFARQQVLIHHPSGALYLVKTGAERPRVAMVATAVAAVRAGASRLVCVTAAGSALEVRVLEPGRPAWSAGLGEGTGRTFLSGLGHLVAVAHEEPGGSWSVHWVGDLDTRNDWPSPAFGVSLRPPAGTTVVGVAPGKGGGAELLLLEDDRRDFTLLGERGSRLVHGAGAEVVAVAMSPANRAFAYTTSTGGVVVYSLEHDAVVLRLVPGEDAAPRQPEPRGAGP